MASKKLPRTSKKQRSPWVRRLKQAFVLFGAFVFIAVSVLGFFYFKARRNAEEAFFDINGRIEKGINTPTTKMVSRDGVVLYTVSKEYRTLLKLNEIPKFVQNAVIAAEDKRFYQHSGVDMTSILRAVFVDVRRQKLSQGSSTITMQLVKLLFNGSKRTFDRKMNDIAYAQALEQRLPKDRILELYLNKVFFGEGAYGIGEAAKVYFNKNISELTIGEAAMLARCIRRPSYENPIRDIEAATQNRDVVLGIMRAEHMITDEQYEQAVTEKPHINPKPNATGIHIRPGTEHFVDHVMKFVEKDLGLDLNNGGYTIETSLDYSLQKQAVSAVKDFVANHRSYRVNQGAFMAMDSDGFILAEVGALNYSVHHQNIVTSGSLQPGSGFKPILYATALKQGTISMDSMLSNAPIREVDERGKVWEPKNASRNENQSSYSLRSALANSINLCAIHTIQQVGPTVVVQTAYDSFGFKSKLEPYDPLALGASAVTPLEMAEAYSVFMLHGDRVHPQPVLRILDADGTLVKQYEPQRFSGAFDGGVSDQVDELLRGVVEHGTGTEALSVPDARGKTGTTNDAKDAWFTGYADGVLATAWFGHEVRSGKTWVLRPMSSAVYGGTTAAKVWADIMSTARDKYARNPGVPKEDAAPKPKPKDPEAGPEVDPDLVAVPPSAVVPPDGTTTGDVDANSGVMTSSAPGTSATTKAPDDPLPGTKPKGTDTPPLDAPPAVKTKRAEKPKDDEAETVTVDICVDSGLIANPYCQETVSRTFKKGKEPKRKCRIHGPGD